MTIATTGAAFATTAGNARSVAGRRGAVSSIRWLCLSLALCCAACDRHKTPAAESTATVTLDEAAAATYPSENTAGGFLRLTDGRYEDSDLVNSELDELSASGDLDNDGSADRAVLLTTSTGGSGVFRELYVLRRAAQQLLVSQPALLGDRVEVNELHIDNGDVVVELVVQGADDPLCCPTQHVTYRFRLSGNSLQETTGQQRVYLKQ